PLSSYLLSSPAASTEISTLSLHDALPISIHERAPAPARLEGVLVHAMGGAAHAQGDPGAGRELTDDRTVVFGVGGAPDSRDASGRVGQAAGRRQANELAEVPPNEIDQMHSHV